MHVKFKGYRTVVLFSVVLLRYYQMHFEVNPNFVNEVLRKKKMQRCKSATFLRNGNVLNQFEHNLQKALQDC